ncbi:hypothetical protein ASD99_11860 [Mesorhizobium sp. Root695]|jgi:hypothetical protein|uniref:hypothetical protein n=1 Tax=Mesorhizobium sp. Root695 TaxID=1736589 RepID=UPI00070A7DE2|nr:hypothetical protein [Mesorhizobium sp. Root695]KRB15059.1 hypothetical protein ASD99_11860 [Mesorhizobium sp. Root695]
MPTISRLFDSHAQAARVASDLVAAGIPRVQIAIIGPYNDEVGSLWISALGVILGAAAGGLACLSAVAAHGISPLAASVWATVVAGGACGGVAGGLLGTFPMTAVKTDDRSNTEGIVLVTAHVDGNETDIAQAMLDGCAPTTFVAEAA